MRRDKKSSESSESSKKVIRLGWIWIDDKLCRYTDIEPEDKTPWNRRSIVSFYMDAYGWCPLVTPDHFIKWGWM